jgi:hypothetical protein
MQLGELLKLTKDLKSVRSVRGTLPIKLTKKEMMSPKPNYADVHYYL